MSLHQNAHSASPALGTRIHSREDSGRGVKFDYPPSGIAKVKTEWRYISGPAVCSHDLHMELTFYTLKRY